MTTDSLEAAKDQFGAAVDTLREAVGTTMDNSQELRSEVARSTAEHATDALHRSEQFAKEQGGTLKEHPGRGIGVAAFVLLLIAGILIGRRVLKG